MMMRPGYLCELCNTIFKTKEEVLQHFIMEHTNVAMVKLKEFIMPHQYLDTGHDANVATGEGAEDE